MSVSALQQCSCKDCPKESVLHAMKMIVGSDAKGSIGNVENERSVQNDCSVLKFGEGEFDG